MSWPTQILYLFLLVLNMGRRIIFTRYTNFLKRVFPHIGHWPLQAKLLSSLFKFYSFHLTSPSLYIYVMLFLVQGSSNLVTLEAQFKYNVGCDNGKQKHVYGVLWYTIICQSFVNNLLVYWICRGSCFVCAWYFI